MNEINRMQVKNSKFPKIDTVDTDSIDVAGEMF